LGDGPPHTATGIPLLYRVPGGLLPVAGVRALLSGTRQQVALLRDFLPATAGGDCLRDKPREDGGCCGLLLASARRNCGDRAFWLGADVNGNISLRFRRAVAWIGHFRAATNMPACLTPPAFARCLVFYRRLFSSRCFNILFLGVSMRYLLRQRARSGTGNL